MASTASHGKAENSSPGNLATVLSISAKKDQDTVMDDEKNGVHRERQAATSSPLYFFLGQSWSSEKQKITAVTKHYEKPEPKRSRAMFPQNEWILVF